MSIPKMGKSGEDVYVIAKYDYQAQASQELDIRKNERLLLLDDTKHWWKVSNSKNQSGFVPSNFVKREKPSIFDSFRRKVKKKSESKMSPTASPVTTKDINISASSRNSTSPKNKALVTSTALAKYNYTAQQSDEISLVKGTRVVVMEKSSDGWWKGEYEGCIGWFPSNYVLEEVDDLNDVSHNYTPAGSATGTLKDTECLDVVLAMYSYSAQNEEEMSFHKGEHLEIIDRPANDPGWWRARNQAGEVGLVPKNYVKVITMRQSSGTLESTGSSSSIGRAIGGSAAVGLDLSRVQTEISNISVTSAEGSPIVQAKNRGPLPVPVLRQDLLAKSWYIGNVTRSQCDQMLSEYGQDGDFLIRDSETNIGDFSVSLKAPNRNKHFRVHVEEGIFCIGQRTFSSLDDLVEHYKRAPIYTSPRGDKMYLIKPLKKP
ncbi:cytoplasmic protein NCK1-like [Limulus polyphemus]|uniref:Cytoplasmic protein NCK1-like n=1 Tax=Limulus polyphemus TaxID=6850 RepID=A0ABM1BIU5_LIMPO|nr:cytoplasmic protein NCK1-like [Limulus polyphemus]